MKNCLKIYGMSNFLKSKKTGKEFVILHCVCCDSIPFGTGFEVKQIFGNPDNASGLNVGNIIKVYYNENGFVDEIVKVADK